MKGMFSDPIYWAIWLGSYGIGISLMGVVIFLNGLPLATALLWYNIGWVGMLAILYGLPAAWRRIHG